MGQQYIETIGMYTKKKQHWEYPSEVQCYDHDNKLAEKCRDMIFNHQYGIFYYEPSSKHEAEQICKKFELCIKTLRKKLELEEHGGWDISFTDHTTGELYRCDWVFVGFPSGKTGYRLEYLPKDGIFSEDFGTLYVDGGMLKIVQW